MYLNQRRIQFVDENVMIHYCEYRRLLGQSPPSLWKEMSGIKNTVFIFLGIK